MSRFRRQQIDPNTQPNHGIRIDARRQSDPLVQAGARGIHRDGSGRVVGAYLPGPGGTWRGIGTKAGGYANVRRNAPAVQAAPAAVAPVGAFPAAAIVNASPSPPVKPAAPRRAWGGSSPGATPAPAPVPMDSRTRGYMATADAKTPGRRITPPAPAATPSPAPAAPPVALTPQLTDNTGSGKSPMENNGQRYNRLTGKPLGWMPGDAAVAKKSGPAAPVAATPSNPGAAPAPGFTDAEKQMASNLRDAGRVIASRTPASLAPMVAQGPLANAASSNPGAGPFRATPQVTATPPQNLDAVRKANEEATARRLKQANYKASMQLQGA